MGRRSSEETWVELNGQSQWTGVFGDAPGKPLLLFLHGGPGSAMSLLHERYFRPLEADFTVVHWDQRGAGRTFGRHGKNTGQLSIDLLTRDGTALAEHLRARFPGRPLVVLGTSWGSVLGAEMVRARPELFDAFIGAGQVVDMERGEALSYTAALEWARRDGRHRAAAALEKMGPPPYASLRMLGRQRSALIAGTPVAERQVFKTFFWTMLTAPGARPWDMVQNLMGGFFTIFRLWKELLTWRLEDDGLRFTMPVLILQGMEDMQTPTPLVEEVFPKLQAPAKSLLLVPEAGHVALLTHMDLCLAEIRRFLLPALGRKEAA